MSLDLLTRAEKGSALNIAEHDANLDAIAAAVNANETAIAGKADASGLGELATKNWSDVAQSGSGAPTASARHRDDTYYDTTGGIKYRCKGTTGAGAADWEAEGGQTLAANQYAVQKSDNSGLEARTDKRFATFAGNVTADGTYPWFLCGDIPVTGREVSARTLGGSCSIKIQKNGSDINGFGSAVALNSSGVVDTATTETFAEDDRVTVVVSSASSLTGLWVTAKGTRTGA